MPKQLGLADAPDLIDFLGFDHSTIPHPGDLVDTTGRDHPRPIFIPVKTENLCARCGDGQDGRV